MRRTLIGSFLALVLFPAALMAADAEANLDPKALDAQIAAKKKEMELKALGGQLEFENKLRELELEEKKLEIEAGRRKIAQTYDRSGGGGPHVVILLVLGVVHILTAVWVYMDIRHRNAGSGIWIVVSLLTGLFGALVYGIVRLGDIRGTTAEDEATGEKKK